MSKVMRIGWLPHSIFRPLVPERPRLRGKHVLMAYKDLRDKFGPALAKNMLEEKKAMQKGKSKNDPVTYWMEHPDIKNNQDLVVHQNYACVTM